MTIHPQKEPITEPVKQLVADAQLDKRISYLSICSAQAGMEMGKGVAIFVMPRHIRDDSQASKDWQAYADHPDGVSDEVKIIIENEYRSGNSINTEKLTSIERGFYYQMVEITKQFTSLDACLAKNGVKIDEPDPEGFLCVAPQPSAKGEAVCRFNLR